MNEPDLFGDGVALPQSAVRPFDAGIPTLAELNDSALSARAIGRDFIFFIIPGYNRPWALNVVVHGLRGTVVKRFRAPATEADVKAGRPIDSGAVAQLTVRLGVIDVLLAYKRDFVRRTNPNSAKLPVNRKRHRLIRNISIR